MSDKEKVIKSEDEWKKVLSPEQYEVLREKGTEMPYSGKYYLHKEKGTYVCAGCGAELFKSDTKFDAGCGWPSFSDVIDSSKVVYTKDRSHGMIRTEITCAKCGGHLGHVFDDGPAPTGQRYCINSVSIDFKK
jgi:peptide-methionine (R)-S-oxide reductase